ncbi:uncharacterized protein RAG0_16492 [Rhynchosporium agropyri]|uniref:BTB domain-containing protein n=1 Tax=Rhynchosporium agropyri TaxID=914238 RepID=A0A1E1LQL9_9HELO|nr:uncharacterized protein RAG0_16492 [Rhynchosporium agropyri]
MTSITASMFSTGKYSDLLIKCKGKEWKVHRAIVCLQSKPLTAAIDGKFKEAMTGEINLYGNEPEIVQCMLQFLYTSDYKDGSIEVMTQAITNAPESAETPPWTSIKKRKVAKAKVVKISDPHELVATSAFVSPSIITYENSAAPLINAKVYIIGDQLDIQALKKLAKVKYEALVSETWNSDSFMTSLELLYKETSEDDRVMREAAVKIAGQHAKELCDRGEFISLCK